MSSAPDWDQELDERLRDIRRNATEFSTALSRLRGHGTARGVSIEVDSKGDITSLQIAPSAMSWSAAQLSHVLVECHRSARTDVEAQASRLLRAADPQLRMGSRNCRQVRPKERARARLP